MTFGLFKRHSRNEPDAADIIHASVVAAARRPALYRDLGVPDTLPGRFELIVLHTALTLRRLRADGEAAASVAQGLFDAMCRSLDANLREIGVGDVSVPKRMKAMVRSFYDGAAAYDRALDAQDDRALEDQLVRIVFAGAPSTAGAPGRLAAYVRRSDVALGRQSTADLLARGPAFPSRRIQRHERSCAFQGAAGLEGSRWRDRGRDRRGRD